MNSNYYRRYAHIKGRLYNDGDPVFNHSDTNRFIRGAMKTQLRREINNYYKNEF